MGAAGHRTWPVWPTALFRSRVAGVVRPGTILIKAGHLEGEKEKENNCFFEGNKKKKVFYGDVAIGE